jgi:hypothetical protein
MCDTYILLHVLLAMLEGRLAKLGRHLRRRIVHELPISPKDVAGVTALLLVRSSSILLRLRRTGRRWW